MTYSSIYFSVKISLLHFEASAVVLNFSVSAVLDIHGRLLTLSLSDASISVGLQITISGRIIKNECSLHT